MFNTAGSRARGRRSAGGFVAFNVYTANATITIPKGATKAFVRMVGGGGGAKSATNPNIGTGGNGAYLEKFLTGLSPGLTLTFTVGTAGSSTPGAGGNSTLVSGSQSITTLTAGGGSAGNAAFGAGGAATGGDLNVPGANGGGCSVTDVTDITQTACAMIGGTPLGGGSGCGTTSSAAVSTAGTLYGGGAVSVTNAAGSGSAAGAAGVCVIEWFA